MSLHVTIFGLGFSCFLRTVIVNLWKSDNPVSTVSIFINDLGKFVRIKCINDNFSGFYVWVGGCAWVHAWVVGCLGVHLLFGYAMFVI